jgi:hypothetical protein
MTELRYTESYTRKTDYRGVMVSTPSSYCEVAGANIDCGGNDIITEFSLFSSVIAGKGLCST